MEQNLSTHPIRVLHIFGSLRRGGLETFVMNLYRAIDRTRIQFDFLVNEDGGDYKQEVQEMGGRIYMIAPRNTGILKYRDSLNAFFKTHAKEYEAVHMHTSFLSSIEPLEYAKKYSIPIRIVHSHSSAIPQTIKANKLHYILHLINKRFIPKIATHYLGCSEKANTWLFSKTIAADNALIIPNGIDSAKFAFCEETRSEVRAEMGIDDDAFVVGHVGSFSHVKNHKFIISVFENLVQVIPEARLILVGDGYLRPEIENNIPNAIKDKVIFTGIRTDIHRILQAMDVFIMPSLFEGLPVALVEAQASGLPIVISDTISHDVKLTPDVTFLPLECNLSTWVDTLAKYHEEPNDRQTSEQIKQSGFDIKTSANILSNLYLQQ